MDLLEYQGKRLFGRHDVPVPEGPHGASVPEAVEAAEELGYPVVFNPTQVSEIAVEILGARV